MDVEADIEWIQNELNSVKDPLLIEAFKNSLIYRKTNKVADEDRMSIEQYNKELEISISQIEKGEFCTSEEMKERIAKWEENNLDTSGG